MIVQCESCRTKFNINEKLLKKEGSKVKCSRCEIVFLVFPPEASKSEDWPQVPADQEAPEIEDSPELDSEMDFDFDESFVDDLMEDISDLESEYHKDSNDFVEKDDVAVPSEDIEEKTVSEPVEEKSPVAPVPEKKKSGQSRTLLVLFIVIGCLIGVIYAVYQYYPNFFPDIISSIKKPAKKAKSVDTGASRLEILTVDGSFIDSEKAGRLFVISGNVKNCFSTSKSFILIKGCILDDKGDIVDEKTAFAGNSINEDQISPLTLEEIGLAVDKRQGIDNVNINVQAGAIIDFMIVFSNLPDNLSEFTVGAVSSSPGDTEVNSTL